MAGMQRTQRPEAPLGSDVSWGDPARLELLGTIEGELVPRLMLVHRAALPTEPNCIATRGGPTTIEISQLVRFAVEQDLTNSLALIEALCCQGLSLESVLLDFVAAAARLLGDQWLSDARSFTEVSAGLGTLQQVVHVLGPSFAPAIARRGTVLLMAAPGEQHTLGLFLTAEFVRRAGFGVQVDPSMPETELVAALESQRIELLGISVSNTHLLKPVARMIAAAHKASLNPNLGIVLGGSLELRDFAARHGAELCTDPRDAVRWLERHGHFLGVRN